VVEECASSCGTLDDKNSRRSLTPYPKEISQQRATSHIAFTKGANQVHLI